MKTPERGNPVKPTQFQRQLLDWFDQHGRKNLPWQVDKNPYRVWLSEIMLQQTQVKTVVPYYKRFVLQFPDLPSLARASEEAVLHLWAGLGYYSRARNLHKTAIQILAQHAGIFPSTLTALMALPGIGRSTAAAILSIAFNQAHAILDGNVKRVLARFHGIQEAVNDKRTEAILWELAEHYMPKKNCANYTQAMMDLGAMVCTRSKPDCDHCPFRKHCHARIAGNASELPRKKKAKLLPVRQSTFLIFKKGTQILLCKRPSQGIWGGLWSLPELSGMPDAKRIHDYCHNQFSLKNKQFKPLTAFKHSFTHFHLELHPVVITIKNAWPLTARSQIWYNLNHPQAIGLPKPMQNIIKNLI